MAIATINPATGETVKEFPADDAAAIDRKIGEAEAAFQALKSTTFAQRAEWMRASADLIEKEADDSGGGGGASATVAVMTIAVYRP